MTYLTFCLISYIGYNLGALTAFENRLFVVIGFVFWIGRLIYNIVMFGRRVDANEDL